MKPLSRITQGWLLAAQIALVLPLAGQASPPTLAIVALCFLWRLGIFYARWARPPKWLINVLGLGSVVALLSQVGSSDTMTSLVNLLLLGYSLKAVEARHSTDLMVVVLTGYFLIGLQLLNRFGPGMTVQLLVMVVVNSACMLSSYRLQSVTSTLGLSAKMVLASIPLTIMMFVLIPRLPPIWQIQSSGIARTGLSDQLALGDVAALTRSDELVMRASFDGALPPPNQLYWRALVLDHYEAGRWSKAKQSNSNQLAIQPQPPFRTYQLQLEASNQRWLPALRGSISNHQGIELTYSQRLQWQYPQQSRTNVKLSQGQLNTATAMTTAIRFQNLQLPIEGNPQSRKWAMELVRQYPDAKQRMQALMDHFNQQPFRYTLTPPAIGTQQIDDFLFGSQAGFCGHYASATVFIARASGIPARLVTGYQGGEPSPDGDFLSVYQYNAHAWVEYWLDGLGWQRLDPTAAVAPERVEQGAESAFADQPAFRQAGGWFTWRNSSLLRELRGVMAQLDYNWSRYVIGLNSERQSELWQRWFGGFQWWKLAAMLTLTILAVGLWQSGIWRRSSTPNKALGYHQRCQKRLQRWQLQRLSNETINAHLARIAKHDSQLQQYYLPFANAFIQHQYNPQNQVTEHELKALAQQFLAQTRKYRSPYRGGDAAVAAAAPQS